ncbi:retrovirus-related Pol polyprotein from transposon 412 [Trichonephila clavipes]|nr:retrovirus-related Pol polyprotein from transposon 412 [Trichonephila clavipes]
MIRWALKLEEFNIEWEHRPGTQNTIADVLSRNPIESIIGETVNCAIIRDLVLSSRNQLIEEQKTDPKLRHIYRYLENPEDSSVNAAICHMCQINNYKNALPASRLIPIISNYPNEIVTLDLLGPYPVSRVKRNRYVLVITDHFSKWAEIITLKKSSARIIAENFFDNYISRFGAAIKLISDNGPQFISDIFENLSERLGIRHVKTVVYRPQANRTERVNRDLVQMIANYVNEQHDTWDQFLREFAYSICTAVNETTGKTQAELFLGRKLITPFQKLVMVSDGTEFAVGDIERLFEEARRNTETKQEKWKKYYNRRRRDVQIKVNDWVLVATHPLSSATRKVVAKFKPKFEGPYRVLDVKNNNVVIWKAGKRLTINVDQVRIYRHRKCDETEIGTGSSDNGSLRDESSGFDRVQRRSNDSRDGKKKGLEVKRELEGKGLSFRNNQGEKHTNKTNKRGPLIRSIPSSWSEKDRMIKKSKNQEFRYKKANESRSGGPERKVQKGSEHRVNKRALSSKYRTNHSLTKLRKKSRREGTVMPTTSGYNLRPRIGKREESRPTIERKTTKRTKSIQKTQRKER